VRASKVLQALGVADDLASGALRVSLGIETTKDDVLRFADAWTAKCKKRLSAA
jgi:cysteine desulfurase